MSTPGLQLKANTFSCPVCRTEAATLVTRVGAIERVALRLMLLAPSYCEECRNRRYVLLLDRAVSFNPERFRMTLGIVLGGLAAGGFVTWLLYSMSRLR